MARLTEKEAKELWTKFACAAISSYGAATAAEDIEDDDELADDMATVASKCADAMLDEYEERFAGGPRRRKKAVRRAAEPEEEVEDDDDLEEEDE